MKKLLNLMKTVFRQLGNNNISSLDVGILEHLPLLSNLGLEKNKINSLEGKIFHSENQLAIL